MHTHIHAPTCWRRNLKESSMPILGFFFFVLPSLFASPSRPDASSLACNRCVCVCVCVGTC